MLTAAKLHTLEDERFYSVMDVALDIRAELDFGAESVVIPVRRSVIRYNILYPTHSPNMLDRYCELRWKAAEFLKREGYLLEVNYVDAFGMHRWDNQIEVVVANPTEFYQLLVTLGEEEERRQGSEAVADFPGGMVRLEQLCDRFHRVALSLRDRHAKRAGYVIDDEYDVQDLLGALLETRFSDIRPEEYTPSYAGKRARVDFLLKEESIMVETKMARDGLDDVKVGDELILDIARYKGHPGCKALFCFVYDPEHRLKNPDGLEAELSRKTDGLLVRVQVRPKR